MPHFTEVGAIRVVLVNHFLQYVGAGQHGVTFPAVHLSIVTTLQDDAVATVVLDLPQPAVVAYRLNPLLRLSAQVAEFNWLMYQMFACR
ncbi:hypothetical protein D3C76_1654430 [compost metagenome]